MPKGTILVADDDAAVRTVVNQALVRAGYTVRLTSNFTTLWQWISAGEGDCVISDVIMPDGEAFDLLPQFGEARPELPIILISAQNTFMTALRAQEGAVFEYLPKPFDLNQLINAVERAINEPKPSPSPQATATYAGEMPLIGRSAAMQEIYRTIARLRQSDDSVLLTGEPGTGKSLIAKVIHQFGPDPDAPFSLFNLEALPGKGVPAGLFSDVGTGSAETSEFSQNRGTLYFRDVLNMSQTLQGRLGRVLLENQSGSTTRKSLPRIVSATSGDIEQAVRDQVFNEDLYYRLTVIPIHIPPLRERPEDIPDLARHFLKKSELSGTVGRDIEPDGMQLLRQHSWPGNIRELENLIRRISLLHNKEIIGRSDIEEHLRPEPAHLSSGTPQASERTEDSSSLVSLFQERYFGDTTAQAGDPGVYQQFIDDYEQPLITAALRATNGNQIKAAQLLGLNRNTLRKKISQHGIEIIRTVR